MGLWEVAEWRVLASWEQFVVGQLPWLSSLTEDLLKMVLVDHGTGVVSDSSLHLLFEIITPTFYSPFKHSKSHTY